MKLFPALMSGLAGACALTALHELIKRSNPDAPRADLLGMNAVSKLLTKADVKIPEEKRLFAITMAGDIIANSLYYSLAAAGNKNQIWLRGTLLGLAAGIGATVLPEKMGLNDEPVNRTKKTSLLTIALYLAGGIMTSTVATALATKDRKIDFF